SVRGLLNRDRLADVMLEPELDGPLVFESCLEFLVNKLNDVLREPGPDVYLREDYAEKSPLCTKLFHLQEIVNGIREGIHRSLSRTRCEDEPGHRVVCIH